MHKGYYLPKVEIKDYNVRIDGKNVFDQPVKNDMRTYDIREISAGQAQYQPPEKHEYIGGLKESLPTDICIGGACYVFCQKRFRKIWF